MITGIYTALVTPFDKLQNIDWGTFYKLLDYQLQSSVHGLVVCGTTAETPTLDESEQLALLSFVSQHTSLPIVMGAGGNNTKQVCAFQKKLEPYKIQATLQVTPYYNKPTQEGLYRHFREVAEVSKAPLILYNVPGRTGVDLEPKTLFRLVKECQNIIAIKECNLEPIRLQKTLSMLRHIRPDFSILGGEDAQLLTLLALGGHGLIASGSNLMPHWFVELYEAFQQKDLPKAQKKAYEIAQLTHLLFYRTHPIPLKTAMALKGLLEKPYFRLPLCELEQEDFKYIQNELLELSCI